MVRPLLTLLKHIYQILITWMFDKVISPDSTELGWINWSLGGAIAAVLSHILSHGSHGSIAAGLFDIAPRHAGCDFRHMIQVKVVSIHFGVLENQLQDPAPLFHIR